MNIVADILDSIYPPDSRPLKIVETGCKHSRDVAKWVAKHPECSFDSVDLDGRLQEATHAELECDGTAKYCTFHSVDTSKYLSDLTWIDCAFLHSADLQKGIEEFSLAVSGGANLIVFVDYQQRAAAAVRKAKALGWKFTSREPYCILKRQ